MIGVCVSLSRSTYCFFFVQSKKVVAKTISKPFVFVHISLKIQGVHKILCFFRFLENIPDSGLSLFSLGQSVYTHQAGRKPALQQNRQSSEKSQNFKEKTQYLMNTLYLLNKESTDKVIRS